MKKSELLRKFWALEAVVRGLEEKVDTLQDHIMTLEARVPVTYIYGPPPEERRVHPWYPVITNSKTIGG